MSRLTQRTPVSPKPRPLPAGQLGAGDEVSWLPEGHVFSNVHRGKISKFLKGSVLKRVFGSQQTLWQGPEAHKEDPGLTLPDGRQEAQALPALAGMLAQDDSPEDTWASGAGAKGAARGQRSNSSHMGRRNGENRGTSLQAPADSQENLPQWHLDSEVLIPENPGLSPGRDSAAGGKINKNHLESQEEELLLELPLSEKVPCRIQNSNQRIFQFWTYSHEENTMDTRKSPKFWEENGFSVTDIPVRLLSWRHSSTWDSEYAGSHAGLPVPSGLCWPYADGDFLKDTSEFHMDSCSTAQNNIGDPLSAPNWNLKYANSNVEENVTDESDLSENEKINDTLLGYLQTMELSLKPERVEDVEESFTEEPRESFVYADFLPAPFNALDLHKFALSKCENWKAVVGPPESSMEQLITRLLELERLQHMTIQKERPRLQSTFCPQGVLERPSSSKATASKTRQPKPPDPSTLQTSSAEKSREKRKNGGSGKPEPNASRLGKGRMSSRPALKCPSTVKQMAASHDEPKAPRSSCQELLPKPATVQTAQPLVKMVSARCLLPRSPMLVSPIPLSFPENQREEVKAPRNKKKLPRKSILVNKPLYIQKLNCLSPSFIAKGKCSPIDQK